jgi:hypothetical protein
MQEGWEWIFPLEPPVPLALLLPIRNPLDRSLGREAAGPQKNQTGREGGGVSYFFSKGVREALVIFFFS